MTKEELISLVWTSYPDELKKKDVEIIVNSFIDEITLAINRKEKICLSGLGTFFVKKRKGRTFKVPLNNKVVTTPDRWIVRFRASKLILKDKRDIDNA